ncbi:hypothetical protein LARI1_G008444 [Lachnellula arida]|uniref:CENP-V/GFA domain-containing protein n=1 Tax=Lachnellula arida TaxID=1316785 RepID=A0A8T9B336_9HELO|nr:hypothetical protein LARI1_G008444 [Lachnellula arida]
MPTVKGNCLCGEIAYRFTKKLRETCLCHCTDCKNGPVATTPERSRAAEILQDNKRNECQKSSRWQEHLRRNIRPHYFCGECGSSIYSEPEMLEGSLTVIKAGTIHGGRAASYAVQKELYVRDRVGYLEAVEGAVQDQTMT